MEENIRQEQDQRGGEKRHRGYRKFDEEFKREAVRLSRLDGRTVAGTARSLGIDANTLGMWRRQFSAAGTTPSNPGASFDLEREAAHQHEMMQLRQQLKRAEEERDILKKAMVVFGRLSQ